LRLSVDLANTQYVSHASVIQPLSTVTLTEPFGKIVIHAKTMATAHDVSIMSLA